VRAYYACVGFIDEQVGRVPRGPGPSQAGGHPDEFTNLAHDPKQAGVVAELQALLRRTKN
jgi:hypothetical protein